MLDSFPLWLQCLLFPLMVWIVVKGADILIEKSSLIAAKFGISELVIGLTFVAMGTSAPEFAVSSVAAWQGTGGLALGNVVGSNIFNLGFILALCCLTKPILVSKDLFWRDAMVLLVSTFALCFFSMTDDGLQRWEGFLLVGGLVAYLIKLATADKKSREAILEEAPELNVKSASTPMALLFAGVGLSMLLFGSRGMVEVATNIALQFGISDWLIGVTIVAVGTSVPELATAITSITKNRADIGLGNLIGSDIFNIIGVMGAATLIRPIAVESFQYNSLYVLMASMVTLVILMHAGWKLNRGDAIILLGISTLRWIFEIF